MTVSAGLIIPVVNGCTDKSGEIIGNYQSDKIFPLFFKETLGFDVPRAIGAKCALEKGAAAVLFVDGDMDGDIAANLEELINKVTKENIDMALTNCYPDGCQEISSLAQHVLQARYELNREIGLKQAIGVAIPSHGPHAVSLRLLQSVPLRELAIPPVSLSLAAKSGLEIRVGTNIAHQALGSPEKDFTHSELIAETIIGDCIEALRVYRGEERRREKGSVVYKGYHPQRRLDLLVGL